MYHHDDSRKITRKIIASCAALMFLFYSFAPVYASGDSPASLRHAQQLESLRLMRGVGVLPDGSTDYGLNQTPTRLQGIILLVRLLGAEKEALSLPADTPFRDLNPADENARYVAYAWRNGITKGASDTAFHPGQNLTPRMFLTFLFRALGYNESSGDFEWGEQADFAARLGMITPETAQMIEKINLNRGDLADLSYAALTCVCKQGGTLAENLRDDGVFTDAEGIAANVLGENAGFTLDYQNNNNINQNHNINHSNQENNINNNNIIYHTRNIPGTNIPAHILRIRTENNNNNNKNNIRVKAALSGDLLGETASFENIIANSDGAAAIVNANFSDADGTPSGYLMSDGVLLHADLKRLYALGVAPDGKIQIGRPEIYAELKSGSDIWPVYQINQPEQDGAAAVLYTPVIGDKITMNRAGWSLTSSGGKITEFYSVSEGASVSIPKDGYVVYMGFEYAAAFRIPQKGADIELNYNLNNNNLNNNNIFADIIGLNVSGENQTGAIISGGPYLVKNGELITINGMEEDGFDDTKFTIQSLPRAAVGVDADGYLILASVSEGCTILQLGELMRDLNCSDAFNLDGGGSCAMYYDGETLVAPSRELSVTLQIFIDENE